METRLGPITPPTSPIAWQATHCKFSLRYTLSPRVALPCLFTRSIIVIISSFERLIFIAFKPPAFCKTAIKAFGRVGELSASCIPFRATFCESFLPLSSLVKAWVAPRFPIKAAKTLPESWVFGIF